MTKGMKMHTIDDRAVNLEAIAGEGLNTAWLDAQADRQDRRTAAADAAQTCTDWRDLISDVFPLEDTEPELYAADDLLDIAIKAEEDAERERLAGIAGDATRSLNQVRRMIEESGVPQTLDEQAHGRDYLAAEDRTPLATGDAWIDYAGADRLSRPTDDWYLRGSVARRVDVTGIDIKVAKNGNLYARVTFNTSRADGVTLNVWGPAVQYLEIGRGILHVRRENGYINGVGFCSAR